MKGSIIITGASRGIGAAIAVQAGQAGYEVCVNYHSNKEAADAVVGEIEKNGGKAIAVQGDVAKEEDICKIFKVVEEQLASLTALVNNAGIVGVATSVRDMSFERLQNMMATNVTGTILCAREAIKRMSPESGGLGGGIVNISSAAARLGSPHEYVDYAASKGAIDSFTIGLAKELADQKIRVNAVRPGVIYTDIHASGGEPNRVERVKGNVPMQRGGQPEEIADSVMWLLSDKASYVTGVLLDVSGGR